MAGEILPIATAAGRPEDHRFLIGVYGESGFGKTSWVEEMLLGKKRRLCVFDTLCKDYGNQEFCDATGIRYDLVTSSVDEALELIASKGDEGDFRIVARVPDQALTLLKAFVYDDADKRALVTDCTLAIEEISLLMSSTQIPRELQDVIVRGRHSRINLVGIAQVPTVQTNPLYRAQLNYIVSFRQTGRNAIDFFSEYSDEAEKLRTIERGQPMLLKGDAAQLVAFMSEP